MTILKPLGMDPNGQIMIASPTDEISDPNITNLLGRTSTLESEYALLRVLGAAKSANIGKVTATSSASISLTILGLSVASSDSVTQIKTEVDQCKAAINSVLDMAVAQNLML